MASPRDIFLNRYTMIRKIILIVIVVLISEILTACLFLENCGEGRPPLTFRYTSLSVENLDVSGYKPLPITSDTSVQYYGIRMLYNLETIAVIKPTKPLWFCATYADCYFPLLHPLDTITSIIVITKARFDNNHGPGTDVSLFFRWQDRNYDKVSTESLLAADEYPDSNINEYSTALSQRTIDLSMDGSPFPNDSASIFTIDVKLSNGNHLTATTKPIRIL